MERNFARVNFLSNPLLPSFHVGRTEDDETFPLSDRN